MAAPRPPKAYRQRQIQHHAKLGVDAFDFGRYNRTLLVGLENTLTNSHLNPLIQLLYAMPSLRSYCESTMFQEELSLTSELGFLFHKLDQTSGGATEPRNLLRMLSRLPLARQAGILEEDVDLLGMDKLLERSFLFLVEQLHREHETYTPTATPEPVRFTEFILKCHGPD